MWKTATSIFKYFFLFTVATLAIYFYMQNNKPKETFVTNVEPDYRSSIVKIFNVALGRDPQEFEVQMYRNDMRDPNDIEKIRNKLLGSAEYIKIQKELLDIPKPIEDKSVVSKNAATVTDEAIIVLQSLKTDEKLARYREIVKIYQDNLDRLPTLKEINYYTYRMEKDKTFTSEKLIELIQMSKEYSILQKNQTNVVNTELEGNITEAQILLIIRAAYQEVYKTSSLPSEELEDFLKLKYVEYKLDDVKFKKLLILLRDLDLNDVNIDKLNIDLSAKGVAGSNKNVANASASTTSNTNANASNGNASTTPNGNGNGNASTTPNGNASATLNKNANVTSESKTNPSPSLPSCENKFGASWNPTIQTDQICKNLKNQYDINKFYDSLYENIKYEQSGNCMSGDTNRNMLAETQLKRNQFELGNSCSKNNYYSQVDAEIMAGYVNAYDKNLKPQFKNTKYGAFLDDAANTKVGSIMPNFVFKEYVDQKN